MIARLLIQLGLFIPFVGALLFVPARTLAWPAGWFFLLEMTASSLAIGLWLARHDPQLLKERMGSPIQRGQSPWDRVFLIGAGAAYCAWLVFMAWDARRSGWSAMPGRLQGLGAVLIAACMGICFLTFRANRFAAPVVKLQASQQVATGGPYRFVRHPMYAGAILYFLGVPLLLGSWSGLAIAPLLIVGMGARAVGEERVLRNGLAGYNDYAARVRYRFIPLFW
jgi:protein-S-isoprenylcysteine O-methyltransferase Ste14